MLEPNYNYLTFKFDGELYRLDSIPLGFKKVPSKLVIELTRSEEIRSNAETLIRGNEKTKTGSYKYFSGLQELTPENWFIGNYYEPRTDKRSLQLFHFTNGNKDLEIYFFDRWFIENKGKRIEFSESFIYSLK